MGSEEARQLAEQIVNEWTILTVREAGMLDTRHLQLARAVLALTKERDEAQTRAGVMHGLVVAVEAERDRLREAIEEWQKATDAWEFNEERWDDACDGLRAALSPSEVKP